MLHMRYINRTLHVLGHSIYLPVQRIDIITSSQPLRGHQTTYYNSNILIRTQHAETLENHNYPKPTKMDRLFTTQKVKQEPCLRMKQKNNTTEHS